MAWFRRNVRLPHLLMSFLLSYKATWDGQRDCLIVYNMRNSHGLNCLLCKIEFLLIIIVIDLWSLLKQIINNEQS